MSQGQRHGGLERRAADVGEELLGRAHAGDEIGVAASPADLPAGAVEHLGGAGDRDGAVGHAGKGGQREVARVVEDQMLVDLVGDHQQIGVDRDLGDGGQFRLA